MIVRFMGHVNSLCCCSVKLSQIDRICRCFLEPKKNMENALLTKTVYDDYTRNGKNALENMFLFFEVKFIFWKNGI